MYSSRVHVRSPVRSLSSCYSNKHLGAGVQEKGPRATLINIFVLVYSRRRFLSSLSLPPWIRVVPDTVASPAIMMKMV